jgi:hypothetical protein
LLGKAASAGVRSDCDLVDQQIAVGGMPEHMEKRFGM